MSVSSWDEFRRKVFFSGFVTELIEAGFTLIVLTGKEAKESCKALTQRLAEIETSGVIAHWFAEAQAEAIAQLMRSHCAEDAAEIAVVDQNATLAGVITQLSEVGFSSDSAATARHEPLGLLGVIFLLPFAVVIGGLIGAILSGSIAALIASTIVKNVSVEDAAWAGSVAGALAGVGPGALIMWIFAVDASITKRDQTSLVALALSTMLFGIVAAICIRGSQAALGVVPEGIIAMVNATMAKFMRICYTGEIIGWVSIVSFAIWYSFRHDMTDREQQNPLK